MDGTNLPVGYPVHLYFDNGTVPTAEDLYNASLSNPKCNDLRVIYNDTIDVNRLVMNCSPSAIDIWFRSQVSVPAGSSDDSSHLLYYSNASAGSPPADTNQVWFPNAEGDTTNLYYFQEGSGSTAYDSSGYNRNCSIDPTVQWSTGKWGSGLRFNRSNAGNSVSLTCGAPPPLTSFTIEFWYKPDPEDGGRIAGQIGSRWSAELAPTAFRGKNPVRYLALSFVRFIRGTE